MEKSILNLKESVENLPLTQKKLFRRFFKVAEAEGLVFPPKSMEFWIKEKFGKLEAVKKQKIIRVTNVLTGEETFFNELRAKRPIEAKKIPVPEELRQTETCSFCRPLKKTPEDIFGRIKGRYSLTASNVAKYDAWHGLVIFSEHSPWQFTEEKIADFFQTASLWFKKVKKYDPKAIYPFLMWNCLWKAGASLVHGHIQLVVARERPYAKVEKLEKLAKAYQKQYLTDYFDDLFKVHDSLGLAIKFHSTKIISYLTPLKEKEIMVISPRINRLFFRTLSLLLQIFFELGVKSFNLITIFPTLKDISWHLPVLTRILDRGALENQISDIGGMELYSASIVSSDPFFLIKEIKKRIACGLTKI